MVKLKVCLEFPNKNRYPTQQAVETAILLLDTTNVRAYHCISCKGWHMTSQPVNLKIRNP